MDSTQLKIQFEDKILPLLTPDEIFEKANHTLLERLSEDKRFEKKPTTLREELMGEYFSMWANTSPDGGLLLVGYKDDNVITGCLAAGQKRINEIEKCGHIFAPDARYECKHIPIINKDGVQDIAILFRIRYKPDKVVKTVAGKAFIRRGDSKNELTPSEIRELEIDKGQIDFEQEPCNLSYPSEFDMDLIKQYVTKYTQGRNLSEDHTIEDVLRLTHLGTIKAIKFIPNNACALLFAKDPRQIFPGCKIRFLRFEGEQEGTGSRWNAEKDIFIDNGSIPHQIARAEEVLTAQLREFSRLGEDNKFYTAQEYPKEAWYEAVVNACVHRSYEQKQMNIFIKMFDDRLEIESPGGFPPLVTSENIYEMHRPRNPHLMDAMFYLDFVKCAHEGTRRIRDCMIEVKLPSPEFVEKRLTTPVVRVTLRNNVKQRKVWIDKDASNIVGATLGDSLNDHERRIINFIAEHGKISVSQVQRLTGKSWPASHKILVGLKEKGIITDKRKRKGRDIRCRWVLVVKNEKD